MSLVTPINSSSKGSSVAERNLSVLLNAKYNGDNVTTDVALNAFKDYNNAKLGYWHHFKKYTVSIAAYGTALGVPVGGVVGLTYWVVKDYLKEPTKIFTDFQAALTNSTSFVNASTPIIGHLEPYLTPASLAGACIAIPAVDIAFAKTIGFGPVRSVAKWTAQMLSSTIVYAAYKAGEVVSSTYQEQEQEKAETKKLAHQRIIDHLKIVYDDIAEGFLKKYEAVQTSPKAMADQKIVADQLLESFPYIKRELARLDLKSFEIDMVMDKLHAGVKYIQDVALELKTTGTAEDHQYNTELLAILNEDELVEKVLSRDILNHIRTAQSSQFGHLHAIKSYVVAGVSGFSIAAVSTVALPTILASAMYLMGLDSGCFESIRSKAVTCTGDYPGYFQWPNVSDLDWSSLSWPNVNVTKFLNSTAFDSDVYASNVAKCIVDVAFVALPTCKNVATMVALGIGSGIGLGTTSISNSLERYSKEKTDAENRYAAQIRFAKQKLSMVYNGVAQHLSQRLDSVKHDSKELNRLKTDARNISGKMSVIKDQIDSLGFIDSKKVVGKLESVLKNILFTNL